MKKKDSAVRWGLALFLTVGAILLFYDTLFGRRVLPSFGGQLLKALQPVLIGAVLAYLLAPVIDFIENLFFPEQMKKAHAEGRMTSRSARAVSLVVTWAIIGLLCYLLGEPVAVQGMQSSAARGFETEDSAVVNVRFADGALASMTISDATASPWNWEATAREDPQYRPFDADAYFIGGTKGGMEGVLDEVLGKNPNARICISAIALETLGAAIAALTARGLTAEVTQIAVSRTKPAGRLHLLMANNPIFLITGTRK